VHWNNGRNGGLLADVLRQVDDHRASRLEEPLPWNWKARPVTLAA